MIVVDSSVWIAKFRKLRTEATLRLDAIDDPLKIVVGDVILLELLQGARDEAKAKQIERLMRLFRIERMVSPALAIKAAANYRLLRSRGVTVRTSIDMIVGTYCLERGYSLLHDDRDFTHMHAHLGLSVV